jgi:3-hydroxybutyryl-CoA dehydrogenase
MSITTVGIIGAGTMGNGIAQACAVSGINVVMVDISDAAVQKGLATVSGSLDRLIKKEKITAGRQGRGAGPHQDLHQLRRPQGRPARHRGRHREL